MSDETIHLIHTIWSAILTGAVTGLGTIGFWLLKRFVKKVDDKLDKAEFAQLRSDLSERWVLQDKMWQRQDDRLDRVLQGLARINGK